MNSSSSFCHTIILITALLFCVSAETRGCACCSDQGTHSVKPNEPLVGYLLEQINGMQFASAAQLFLIDGPDLEEQVKGLASTSESYVISAVTEPKQWRLTFRTEHGKSGELICDAAHHAPSTHPASIRLTELCRLTTTNIISYRELSRKNRVTSAWSWISRPDAGVCKSVKTWISRD